MHKLIIQIPCYNEEESIGVTLDALPRIIPGIAVVEWLVIDDGSTDNTIQVARDHGADHVIKLNVNRGLARAFMLGIDYGVKAGADIIVNTDADNQYNADDIPKLIQPILDGQADIVIGERPISTIEHFSPVKKLLQKVGSLVVQMASGTRIPDAPSGFRAFRRDAALRLNVFDEYTYTLETIIQAGRKNMAITSVPIRTNPDMRPSRLVSSIPSYIRRSLFTIVRIFMTYRPFRFFTSFGIIAFTIGMIPIVRWMYFWSIGDGSGHLQSLILATFFLSAGVNLCILGLLGDLIGINRILLEDLRCRVREIEYQDHVRRYGK